MTGNLFGIYGKDSYLMAIILSGKKSYYPKSEMTGGVSKWYSKYGQQI